MGALVSADLKRLRCNTSMLLKKYYLMSSVIATKILMGAENYVRIMPKGDG